MERIKSAAITALCVLLMACALLAAGELLSLNTARAGDDSRDPGIGRYQMSCAANKDDDIKCVVMDTASGAIETTYRFEGDSQCQKNDGMNYLFWCD